MHGPGPFMFYQDHLCFAIIGAGGTIYDNLNGPGGPFMLIISGPHRLLMLGPFMLWQPSLLCGWAVPYRYCVNYSYILSYACSFSSGHMQHCTLEQILCEQSCYHQRVHASPSVLGDNCIARASSRTSTCISCYHTSCWEHLREQR